MWFIGCLCLFYWFGTSRIHIRVEREREVDGGASWRLQATTVELVERERESAAAMYGCDGGGAAKRGFNEDSFL